MPLVLIAAHNVALPHAAGVATCGRALAAAMHSIGQQVHLLFGAKAGHSKLPLLNEIALAERDTGKPISLLGSLSPGPVLQPARAANSHSSRSDGAPASSHRKHPVLGRAAAQSKCGRRIRALGAVVAFMGVGLASACQASPSYGQIDPELYDYLVQDVCLDVAGEVTGEDPANCSFRRNLGVNENLPYLLTDWDQTAQIAYQTVSSTPVLGLDGHVRIMVSKSFPEEISSDFLFSFEPSRGDGYDLLDINSRDFTSFIRTFDGGCQDQLWAPALNLRDPRSPRERAGGWLLFPLAPAPSAWSDVESKVHTIAKIQLSRSVTSPGCHSGESVAKTFWHPPEDYVFESGKILRAIKSEHFASPDLSSAENSLELYYFTKEYGFSRWEAWVPRERCYGTADKTPEGLLRPHCDPDRRPAQVYRGDFNKNPELDLRSRCDRMIVTGTGQPDIALWGGQEWVRIDCRDNTRWIRLNKPQLMISESMPAFDELRSVTPDAERH